MLGSDQRVVLDVSLNLASHALFSRPAAWRVLTRSSPKRLIISLPPKSNFRP